MSALSESGPRVLWLTASPLWPQNSGGTQRSYHLIEGCLRAGLRLMVWQPGEAPAGWDGVESNRYEPRSPAGRGEKRRTLLARRPMSSWMLRVPALRRAVAGSRHDLIVADQHVGVALLPELRGRGIPFIHLSHGVEWRLNWSIAGSAPSPYLAAAYGADTAKARFWESRVTRAAAAVAATSDADARNYRRWGAKRVEVVPSGATLGPGPAHEIRPGGRRLLFVGSLAYWPNVDACRFLVREVMPILRAAVPDATVDIVGRAPAAEVAELHAPEQGVRVIGEVPEVESWLRSADAVVVPMRLGHGTRLKVLEAMAHGVPVVATTVADEGLDLGPKGAILATSTQPEEFAASTARALCDPALRAALSKRGRRTIAESFQWTDIGSRFAELVASQAASR